MASPADIMSTSVDQDGSVRRRNVYNKANGGAVYEVEAEDTKKLQKVSYRKHRISQFFDYPHNALLTLC